MSILGVVSFLNKQYLHLFLLALLGGLYYPQAASAYSNTVTSANCGDPEEAFYYDFDRAQGLLVKWVEDHGGIAELKKRSAEVPRGVVGGKQLGKSGVELICLGETEDPDVVAAALAARPDVVRVEPNYRRYARRTPNDTYWSDQVELARMAMPDAWDLTTGSKEVVVAVIDDSFALDHEDLAANIWTNPGEIAGNGIDDDGNGYIDDVNGWDFRDGDNDPRPSSGDDFHGTMVAGSLGAVGNNDTGVTGAAWSVSIMPLRFGFDVASGVEAIQYAIANGADIVNASFGGVQYSASEEEAVQALSDAGILSVVAAGNYDLDNDRIPDYPSGYDVPGILAVAASGADDALTWWSQYGQLTVDVAAPGNSIDTLSQDGGYVVASGTSFSSPYVAAVASLIKAQNSSAALNEMKGRVILGVDGQSSMEGYLAVPGRINGYQSLSAAATPAITIHSLIATGSHTPSPMEDGDIVLGAGEGVDLVVELENVWGSVGAVEAVLSTEESAVTMISSSASYEGMSEGQTVANTSQPFRFRLDRNIGHQEILFTLALSDGLGYTEQRSFLLEVGRMGRGDAVTETIQQNDQDDSDYYLFTIPVGASNLDLSLEGEGSDLDLLLRRGNLPLYLLDSDQGLIAPFPVAEIDETLWVSADFDSSERIQISLPVAGEYYAVVINAGQVQTEYTLALNYDGGPSMVLNSPVDGQEYYIPQGDHGDITLSIETTNFVIGTDGYWHYSIDGSDEVMVQDGSISRIISLPVGEHTVLMKLVDTAHQALYPPIEEQITVTIIAIDADSDGLPDEWEVANFGSILAADGTDESDFDNDGYSDAIEFGNGSDPSVVDPIELEYTIYNGWNLLSIRQDLGEEGINLLDTALQDAGMTLHSIWRFQPDSGRWHYNKRVADALTGTITPPLSTTAGYWLNVEHDGSRTDITINGVRNMDDPLLETGWNLVGVPQTISNLAEYSAANEIESIWTYTQGGWSAYSEGHAGGGTLTTMEPGVGYWVKVTAP